MDLCELTAGPDNSLPGWSAGGVTKALLICTIQDLTPAVPALRKGLCHMIDEGLVDLEQAIDIFNREHARRVMERMVEDNEKRRELGL